MECWDLLYLDASSFKKIYFKYWPFIMKMHVNSPKSDIANKNLSALCDVELIWGCHAYCHCLSVSISSSKLRKAEMFLYAILWRLSSWPNLNYTCCIVILLPSLKMLLLMISMQLETWQMKQCQCNGFLTWIVERMQNTLHSFSLDTSTLFIVLALRVHQLLILSLELLSAW